VRPAVARLKPGGHAAALCGGDVLDLAAVAMRLAGLEIRDTLRWLGGGVAVILARKPLGGTVAGNTLAHGVGGLNIDACRVPSAGPRPQRARDAGRLGGNTYSGGEDGSLCGSRAVEDTTAGRWPANVLHDGSPAVEAVFAAAGESRSPSKPCRGQGLKARAWRDKEGRSDYGRGLVEFGNYGDAGTASRFFAHAATRGGLLRWLARLVVPPGGVFCAFFPPPG
jgi:site-specific DNA-methyltransferase (adenine-specific)